MSHTRPGTFGPSHVQVSGDCACLSLRVWSLRGRESTRPPRQPRSGVHIPHLAPCAHSARQHSSLLTAPPSVPHEYFRMASDAAAPSPCLVTTEPCPAPSSNTSQGTGAVRPELWHRLSPLTSSCSSPCVCPGGGSSLTKYRQPLGGIQSRQSTSGSSAGTPVIFPQGRECRKLPCGPPPAKTGSQNWTRRHRTLPAWR